MSGIKQALTRKLGPLPAWAWAGIAAVGLLWYRNRTAGGAANNGSGAGGVYGPFGQDPNAISGGGSDGSSGGFGGGSGDTTGGSGTDGSSPGNGGAPTINVQMPNNGASNGAGSRHNKRTKKHKHQHNKTGKGEKGKHGRHRSNTHVKSGHGATRAHNGGKGTSRKLNHRINRGWKRSHRTKI